MIAIVSVVVLAIAAGGAGYYFTHRPTLIPQAIRKQVSFVIFVPGKSSADQVNHTTVKYDSSLQLLTYMAKSASNNLQIIISEQATPQSFVDIPQTYDALTTKLNQYGSFDSINGTVYLTRPKELNGGQSAVMNAKGTLLFAKPSQSLSDNDWRAFFNSLNIIQ